MADKFTWIDPPLSSYLNEISGDTLIRRYCSISEIYSIAKKELTLTCPFYWDDPFENPMFRADFILPEGKRIELQEEGEKLFCQSWTMDEESDAHWRLYGSHSNGVCITTSVRDLLFHAYNAFDISNNDFVPVKIGKVIYLTEAEIAEYYQSNDKFVQEFTESNCSGYYRSLLIKRQAYKYENEVRLIAHDFDAKHGCNESHRLTVPLTSLNWIKNISFGPSIDSDTYEAHRARLSGLGLHAKLVSQSQLYGLLSYKVDLRFME